MLSVQDLLDSIDCIRKNTGIPLPAIYSVMRRGWTVGSAIYSVMLRCGWTVGSALLIRLMHFLIRACHGAQVRVLERFWAEYRPDLVVSLIPNFNRALKEALDRAWPGTPFVTLLTDIADYPPHFWIERQDQWVICGSARAAQQAREFGIPEDRILQTSGMILNPKFYTPLKLNRPTERMRLGLRPDLPTGLVLIGSEGSTEMIRIARALNRADSGIQLILLCGKNDAVAGELRAMEHRIPMFIESFTCEVPYYMELADFFIGKPGPGSISEAIAKRLPVIVKRNAWTMAHERYNADWIEEQGLGLVVRNFSAEISGTVRALLAPENYARFRQRAAETRNVAVYEIPGLLEGIFSERLQDRAHLAEQFRSRNARGSEPSIDLEPLSHGVKWC